MACQPLIARKRPPVRHDAYGQEHLDNALPAAQEMSRLVKQAVPEAGTKHYAKEAVYHERVEQLFLYSLFPVEAAHNDVGERKTCKPAQRIPAQGEGTDMERLEVGVPQNVTKYIHCRKVL